MLSSRFIGTPLLLVVGLTTSAAVSSPFDAALPRASSRRLAIPTLQSVEPFRLVVGPGAQAITVSGTDFENSGHPNRDEYMHWQIRRDDGGWERCGRQILNATATCRTTGWSNNSETIEIGGAYTARPGYIELRVFQGLALEGETNPRNAPNPTDWSNVLRVPVVVPGAAPVITSLSPTSFPLSGDAAAYRLVVNASGLDPSAVVVFRGDVVVAPEGMSGGTVQVTVPEQYRRTTPGELPLTVRTDAGGHSAQKYIRFAAQQGTVLAGSPIGRAAAGVRGIGAGMGAGAGAGVGTVAGRRSETCVSGFVWREATPQDHACVTPDARSRAARQNAEAASRRVANPPPNAAAPCLSGYVWREAVAGDVVCVTPAERTQTADDSRLAPSRVAP
ncbi:MAG TPA: hypothetical protein VFS59_00320 [Gemmatimonadaceae bacterium]|nr:hypothetical protein [Gemmatimonadaceae bacterium]